MDAAPRPDPLRLGWRAPLPQSVAKQALLLLGWVLAAAGLEPWLRQAGLGPRGQALAVLAVAVAAAGPVVRGGALFRLLTAVPFALAQLAVLALLALVAAAAAGPWPSAPGWAAQPFDRLAGQGLLALLVLSTLAVAWKRRPYRPSRLGFLAVHLAPALLAAGGLWNVLGGLRTVVQATPATPVPAAPGLQLRLLDLELEASGRERAIHVYRKPAGAEAFLPRSERLPARPGSRLTLADPRCELEVLDVLPDALLERRFREDPAAPEDPALFLLLGIGVDPAPRGYLFSRRPGLDRKQDPGGRFTFQFLEAWDEGLLREAAPGRGLLQVRQGGRGEERAVRPGQAIEGPGWKLVVVAEYPDFAVGATTEGEPVPFSRSDQPKEPWLALDLIPTGGAPRRLLLSARDPQRTAALNAPWLPPGLQLTYLWQEDQRARRVVFTRLDGRIRMLERGRVVRNEPLQPGRPFVVEPGRSLLPVALIMHPREDPSFVAQPRPGPNPAQAVQVRVGETRRWLEAYGAEGEPALLEGGRLGLVYRLEDPRPGDVKAQLALLDGAGRELARGWATAGAPLRHGGFRVRPVGLSLEAAGAALEVEHRPGTPLLWAGWGLLLVGMAWMFHLKPVLKRRERGSAP